MINITEPFLPPIEDYQKYLSDIWSRNWLTNDGPLVRQLEESLSNYLGTNRMSFVSNGTIAIQIAIKALEIKGEIITTPFSYVATTSSIVWENCVPVFVDIDAETLNIDPLKIEEAISENTSAILATHVYGNPCEIDMIENIAKKHNLAVIYDAAHCFGSKYNQRSVLEFGDVSTISFHATKLFHTIEGGGVFASNQDLRKKLALLRNFGHDGPYKFTGVGINGKNSEFHAAMGLVNLKYIDEILARRRANHAIYDSLLKDLPLRKPAIVENGSQNFSYYPIIFETEEDCVRSEQFLRQKEILTRRYFYPPLNTLDYVKNQPLEVVDNIANRVLCLPLYDSLSEESINLISSELKKSFGK